MKNQSTFSSPSNARRYVLAASLSLSVPFGACVASAADPDWASSLATLDTRWNDAPGSDLPMSGAPRRDTRTEESARGSGEGKNTGWSLNLTPVLLAPHNDERLGGGVDPELTYTLDRGAVRLSAGLRIGGYYAKNLFGVTAMPTLRLLVPVGPVEPYVSFGMGYGWLPKIEHAGIATMSRLGVVFRFSESFGLGVEGTIQRIERSVFEFPSFGSALALKF